MANANVLHPSAVEDAIMLVASSPLHLPRRRHHIDYLQKQPALRLQKALVNVLDLFERIVLEGRSPWSKRTSEHSKSVRLLQSEFAVKLAVDAWEEEVNDSARLQLFLAQFGIENRPFRELPSADEGNDIGDKFFEEALRLAKAICPEHWTSPGQRAFEQRALVAQLVAQLRQDCLDGRISIQ